MRCGQQSLRARMEHAARMAWDLDRKGCPLPAQDIFIASARLRHEARVLTRDKHFEVLPGLRLARALEDLGR